MKEKEAANNPAKQIEEAIFSRKQYLDTARDYYLTALAELSGRKQEQPKISPCSDLSLPLEDNICNLAVEAEQAATPGHGLKKKFSEMDVQMQYPNGVLKASEKDLEVVKLQFNKSLPRNTKSQITEMICKLGILGKEIDIIDVADSKTTRTASLEPDNAMESLEKTVVESSSIYGMVESLKAKLENLKKEHAGFIDVDVGAESAARNLKFRFFRSKPENERCFAKRDKAS
ncbi:WEB family protein At5g55860-like [Spinacia oleracea]|uniref:WEB family protein At5g55860-like n=1 Tax=Spinacia oleracea TaxID=3562 RepID=A0A9R0JCI2_SPIOL|nr:WEB family protein At5g55860-like [Spinacia oleracea]